jgi:lysyl-tRNA synthetase, class I
MHWVDVIAEDLLKTKPVHVLASGTSISGVIHIGNAGDVIMAEAITRAIKQKGGQAKLVWIMDDVDPLGKIPIQVQQDFKIYIGRPLSDVPSPDGKLPSYPAFFAKDFLGELKQIGVEPEVLSGRKMYKDGLYDINAKKALENGDKIKKILKEISGSDRGPNWLPFDPICEKCGKIAPTQAFAFVDGKVKYKCLGGVAKKNQIDGCGFEGECGLRNGKLTWRVEWAARWQALGVTCEPFGKEHSASGGSYDTSKVIVKDIFGGEPPYPVLYEHIQVDGAKMSSSVGNVLTLTDMLSIIPPEVVRYFYFRVKPNKHKDLKTRMKKGVKYSLDELRSYLMEALLKFADEYERVERIYFGVEKATAQEDEVDIRRTYELSQVHQVPSKFFQVPYSHLVTVAQITEDWKKAREIIGRNVDLSDPDPKTELRLVQKYEKALYYAKHLAPADTKFTLLPALTPEIKAQLTEDHKKVLKNLLDMGPQVVWKADALHKAVHEARDKAGQEPKTAFQALYLVLLGKTTGPRLGYFMASLEKDWVLKRLREAVA